MRSIEDLHAETKPGRCVICGEKISPNKRKRRPSEKQDPRPRRTCGKACRQDYGRLLVNAWRADAKRSKPVQRIPMPADAVPAPGELR